MTALPLISSLVIPTAVQAASCTDNGQPCTANGECCSGMCFDLGGFCINPL